MRCRDDDVVISENDLLSDGEKADEFSIEIGEEYEAVYSPPLTDTEDGPVMTEAEYQALLVCDGDGNTGEAGVGGKEGGGS